MSYAVMPLTDYKDMCDKVREKIPVNLLENATFEEREIGEYTFLCSTPFHLEDKEEYTLNFPNATASKNLLYIAEADWNGSNYDPGSILDTNFPYSFFPIDQCDPIPETKEYRIFIYKPDNSNYIDTTGATLVKVDNTIKSGEMPSKIEEVYEAGKSAGGDTEAAYNEGLEAGQKAERERFWNGFFSNLSTRYLFTGSGWNINTFSPIYPNRILKPTTTERMFAYFNRTTDLTLELIDLTELCEHFDFSSSKTVISMFENARAKNITCDFSSATALTSTFMCSNGGSQDNITIKVTEKCTSFIDTFAYNTNLATIRFMEGSVIAANISFAQSNLLTPESVDSIINALKDRTGSTSLKLTVHKDVYNRMVASGQDALVTAKNWTLVSA